MIEEEFRSQNSGASPAPLRLRSESRRDAQILANAALSASHTENIAEFGLLTPEFYLIKYLRCIHF